MLRPTNITLNKNDKVLEISWNDGTDCRYPLSHLREACPCVQCRGGHQYMGAQYDPENILKLTPARDYTMVELHPVGNYAIQPIWNDQHSTGIYTWEYLKRICPPQDNPEK